MSTDNKQQSCDNNSEPSPELINACAKMAEAINSAHAGSDQAVVDFIQQHAATAGENLKTAGAAVADFAVDAAQAAADSAIETGSNWADSLLKNNAAAQLITGNVPHIDSQALASAMLDVDRLSLEHQREQGFIGTKVDRATFHYTTVLPICTANAVLRCSCGLAFGPLKVLPLHRVQIGTPPNPVATITDCIPNEINIPQFVLCFNILNPAVLALTTAATIAKGGVFTLTPAPCFGSMAPSPWIPTTKNTCGKTPLLTQASCSNCWGLGSINILHCGQGIQPGLLNRFRVPGDVLATIQGYAESLVNLAGGLGAFSGVASKLSGPVTKILQKVKLEKVGQFLGKHGLEGLEIIGNATTGIISGLQGKTGDALSVATDLGLSLLGKRNKANAPKRREKAQTDHTTAQQNRQAADDRLNRLQGENSPQTQANNRFNEADTARTRANNDLQAAKDTQGKANKKLSDAQSEQKKADKKLTDAQTQQSKAQKDLDTATQNQAKANEKVETAKTKQRDAENKVTEAEKTQQQANKDLGNAKEHRDKVYNDPKSTPQQKADADKAVADAEKTKHKADADLGTARNNKTKADNGLESAKNQKAEADLDVSTAQRNKQQADLNAANAHVDKANADMNVTSAKGDKQLADQDVATKKGDKANADQEYKDAKVNKREEDANVRQAEKEAEDAKKREEKAKEKLEHIDDKHPVKDFAKGVAKPVILNEEKGAINNYSNKDKPKEDYDKYLALLDDI